MIYRNMHRADARAPFLESSLGRGWEACSADPIFCQSKRRSYEAAADRSDRALGKPRLAHPAPRTTREFRQLLPDPEVILPKP